MNPTVLIIDDDKTIRSSLGYLFKNKGCDVYEAGTAADGIRLAEEVQPDLTILDHRLPDKTGLETLVSMRTVQPDIMVIMLTGYGSISGAVDAIRAGAFDYLVKPVDIGSLEIASNRAFDVHGLMKENRSSKSTGIYTFRGTYGWPMYTCFSRAEKNSPGLNSSTSVPKGKSSQKNSRRSRTRPPRM